MDLLLQFLVDKFYLFHGGGMLSIVQGCKEFFLKHPSCKVDWWSVLYRVVQHHRGFVAVDTELL